MDILTIIIAVGGALLKLLPAAEQYGPQIIADLKQDWDMLVTVAENGGAPTQEQHDTVMANLNRAHALLQANTSDVDDVPLSAGA